jgi:hypothetical protein
MDAATALMVLLSCTGDGHNCQEMRASEAYQSVTECREALPSVLRRLTTTERTVIGRCTSAEGGVIVETDPIDTGSISDIPGNAEGFATVQVTRLSGGGSVTTSYIVPKSLP